MSVLRKACSQFDVTLNVPRDHGGLERDWNQPRIVAVCETGLVVIIIELPSSASYGHEAYFTVELDA